MGQLMFPNAPQGWSMELAEKKARGLGIELDQQGWEVIRGLQDYFATHEFGNRRELRDALDEKFHRVGGIKRLFQMFPGGPVAQGAMIAGFEPPAGSIDKSFGSVV